MATFTAKDSSSTARTLCVRKPNSTPDYIPVHSLDSTIPTFRGAGSAATPAAACTDLLNLKGTTTALVCVRSVKLSGIATSAGAIPVSLLRRTTAHSGGSSTTVTCGKMRTDDTAQGGVLTVFTANPTVGTAGATMGAQRLHLPLAGNAPGVVEWQFPHKSLVLDGTLELLAVNFGGATIPTGAAIDWEIEWGEEVE